MPVTQELRCVKRQNGPSAAVGWVGPGYWYPGAAIDALIGGPGRTYELFFFWDGTSPTSTQYLRSTNVGSNVTWRIQYLHSGGSNGPGRWTFRLASGFSGLTTQSFNYVLEANEWYHLVIRSIPSVGDSITWSQYGIANIDATLVQMGKVGTRADGAVSTGADTYPFGVGVNGGVKSFAQIPPGVNGLSQLGLRPYGGNATDSSFTHAIGFGGAIITASSATNPSYSLHWKGGWAEERLWASTRSEFQVAVGGQGFPTVPDVDLKVYVPWNDTIDSPHLYQTGLPTTIGACLGVSYGGSYTGTGQVDTAFINDVSPSIAGPTQNPFGFLSHPFQVIGTDWFRTGAATVASSTSATGPLLKFNPLPSTSVRAFTFAPFNLDELESVGSNVFVDTSATGSRILPRSVEEVSVEASTFAEYDLDTVYQKNPVASVASSTSATETQIFSLSASASAASSTSATALLDKSASASVVASTSASQTIDYVRSGEASVSATTSATDVVNETFDGSAEASVEAGTGADYVLNTEKSGTANVKVLASATATYIAVYSRSATSSNGSLASGTKVHLELHNESAVALVASSTSANPGLTQYLSLLLEEGSEILGTPVGEEDDVSVVDVWNNALIRLGSATVTSTTDGSNEQVRLSAVWDQFRTQFLTEHSWNGAKETTSIAKYYQSDGTTLVTPPGRWNHTYVLPSDCLRVLTFNGLAQEPSMETLWEIESRANDLNQRRRVMHTNIAAGSTGLGELQYIRDVGSEVDLLSAKTRHAMSLSLAAWVASSFGKSSLRSEIEAEADRAIRAAKSIDGQEGTPSFFSEDTLSAVRDRDRFGSFGSGSGYYGA